MAELPWTKEEADKLVAKGVLSRDYVDSLFSVPPEQSVKSAIDAGLVSKAKPSLDASTPTLQPLPPQKSLAEMEAETAETIFSKPLNPYQGMMQTSYQPSREIAKPVSSQEDLAISGPQKVDYQQIAAQSPVIQASANAINLAQSAIENQAAAARDYGAQTANFYEGLSKRMQEIELQNAQKRQEAEAKVAERLNDLDQASREYAAAKVESKEEIWAKKSTGQKILAVLGMILGAAGPSEKNQAVKVIDDALNDEVLAQKAEYQRLGNKVSLAENLYALAKKKVGDINQEENAAKLAAYNLAQLQLQAMAARYQGKDQAAKAQSLLADLEMKKAGLLGEIQRSANMYYASQGLGTPEMMTEDQRERYVPGFGGLALSKSGAEKFRNEVLPSAKSSLSSVSKLKELARSGSSLSLEDRAKQAVLVGSLIGDMRLDFLGPGAVTDEERKLLTDLIGKPLKIFSLSGVEMAKLNAIEEKIKTGLNEKAKAIGLVPVQGEFKTLKAD